MSLLRTTLSLLDLPNDVLFQVFSYLPLRFVLCMEHLSPRLHQAISCYLATVGTLNLYSHETSRDIFRCYNENVVKVITPNSLQKLLSRCKIVHTIVYIPSSANSPEIINVILQFKNISHIQFVDSKELLDVVQARSSSITLGEVCISSSAKANLTSTLYPTCQTFEAVSALSMDGITMDSQILMYFSRCIEVTLVRCTFEVESLSNLNILEYPNLAKFVYAEQPGRSASSRVGALLVRKASESEKLKVLQVGLNEFSALDAAMSSWKAIHLEDLEVISTGSYSASLQQLKYASVVADICHLCRANLKRISLPSSILIKRFFTQLISANSHFQQLRILQMTGLADTKMFVSPGNLVETFFYQEFLKLCPVMSSLSLHSFTGSLITLTLPLTLTELVLPWDNRLNLERQRNEIVTTLSVLPHLHSLSILGVEEVDALLQEATLARAGKSPILVINMKSLREFRLANACIRVVDLMDCTDLAAFHIQCCPVLEDINVSAHSLKEVCIYDDHRNYINKFINRFMASRSECSTEAACHIHIQLHSVVRQEPDSTKIEHLSKASDLFSVIEHACESSCNSLDCFALKDNDMHLFEHNSGEHLYPFTSFQVQGCFASSRSDVEIQTEVYRRERVFEGLNRWKNCILDVKAMTGLIASSDVIAKSEIQTVNVSYCEGTFKCATNLSYLERLNSLLHICQPSGLTTEYSANNSGTTEGKIVDLNVPHLNCHVRMFASDFTHDLDGCTVNNLKPLIFISVIEYAHNIYTLFYYD